MSMDTISDDKIKLEIPKVVHYCWFGGNPLPPLAEKCIASWRKFLPDYEIRQWDESNFDVNILPYTAQAYEAKKYAFVSDYARFWILYKYGGLYFDTDVEVIKPLDDIIAAGPFMGCQNKYNPNLPTIHLGVAAGLGIGAYPEMGIYKELIDLYKTINFKNNQGELNFKTVVTYTTEIFINHGLVNTPNIQEIEGIKIYPWDYFCPMAPTLIIEKTNNSRTIHHFAATWESSGVRFRKKIKRFIGPGITKTFQPLFAICRKIIKA